MDIRACEETLTASPLSPSSQRVHTRAARPCDKSTASPFSGRRGCSALANSSSNSSTNSSPNSVSSSMSCRRVLWTWSYRSLPTSRSCAPPCAKRRRVTDTPCKHALWHLADRDRKHVPSRNHLRDSRVTALMREQVVAWSREMADFLRLPIATVAIAINLFDRFVDCQRVGKNVLYALTAACVLIACKQMVDFEVPVDVIARRASTNRADIALVEPLVLNGLQWRVNVVTAYEVCLELGKLFADVTKRGTLLDTLVLNCLMDVDMAWVRASSVGVACFIVTSLFLARDSAHRKHPVYAYARWCGVDMEEVDYCVERLEASIACMFDGVEDDEVEGVLGEKVGKCEGTLVKGTLVKGTRRVELRGL